MIDNLSPAAAKMELIFRLSVSAISFETKVSLEIWDSSKRESQRELREDIGATANIKISRLESGR